MLFIVIVKVTFSRFLWKLFLNHQSTLKFRWIFVIFTRITANFLNIETDFKWLRRAQVFSFKKFSRVENCNRGVFFSFLCHTLCNVTHCQTGTCLFHSVGVQKQQSQLDTLLSHSLFGGKMRKKIEAYLYSRVLTLILKNISNRNQLLATIDNREGLL